MDAGDNKPIVIRGINMTRCLASIILGLLLIAPLPVAPAQPSSQPASQPADAEAEPTMLEIGSAAIMSRAAAGSAHGKVLISLPGSQAAVTLAMEKLVLSEIRHMVSQVQGK